MNKRNKVNDISWNFEFCSAVSFGVQQGRHEKLAKYCPNPLSVTSVCFGFVKTNHIKGNDVDKIVHGPDF